MMDWTEKYRPKTVKQIVGNHSQIRKFLSWANAWKRGNPYKKAVVLSGKPGIGKTSAAYALAHDFDWLPIELNASDARNATTINAVATAGATHQTFSDDGQFISTKTGGLKLIIIDEADNLFERSKDSTVGGKDFGDKDGKRTIVQTVQVTQQPVILIVNDDYQLFKGSGSSLRKTCLHLKMYPAKSDEIVQLLKQICLKEQIRVDAQVLFSIADASQGDIRSSVRDLQSVCTNKKVVTLDDADVLGHRDRSELIFDVLRDIFRTKDSVVIRQHVRMVQEDPRMMLLWVAENLLGSYSSVEDIASAYHWLSKSDMFLGRTFRRSNYGLWSYASDLSTIGVSLSKQQRVHFQRYKFPSWLKKTSKEKSVLSAQKSLIEKVSRFHHCSMKKTRSFILPHLKKMAFSNDDFLCSFVDRLELSDEEAVFLAGKKAKKVLSSYRKEKQSTKDIVKEKKINSKKSSKKNEKVERKDPFKQQSLGSFQ